jgi:hypothetical protein
MVAKLKSILRQIHWSLVLRALVFGAAWFVLPFWLFVLIALGFYFVPWLQAGKLFAPFFGLLVLSLVVPNSIFFAIILAAIFYYLLLIKDLLLIDRRAAYEILIFILAFFLVEELYRALGSSGVTAASVWFGFLVAALIGLMTNSFIRYVAADASPLRRAVAWLVFLLVWQLSLVGFFLPVDSGYQAAIVFLATAIMLDFAAGRAVATEMVV